MIIDTTPSEAWKLVEEFKRERRDRKKYLESFKPEEWDEKRWYDSGETDFSVYQDPEYLWYLTGSWAVSRPYSRRLGEWLNGNEYGNRPLTILDQGAGLGLGALMLASMLPKAEVYASNLAG